MQHRHLAAALAALLALAATARADGPRPLDVARAAWARGARTSHRIATLLDEARRVHDPQRTMCLDDALSRSDAQLRILQQRTELLQRADAAHDTAALARELRILDTVARRLREVDVAADACIGIYRHAGVQEETTVETEIAPDVPPYEEPR